MAGASLLGLSHETYYYSPSSSSCFPPLAAAADSAAAVAMSFAPADFFDGADDRSSFDGYSVVPPLQAPFAGGDEMMTMGMYGYGSRWHANTGADVDVAARGAVSRAGVRSTSATAARIGFRTRSAVEVMDDGFKWRKYGKKAVKSSPNPRNYYRCSSDGCGVKKRVERDSDDPRYVLTTYDGVHNHAAPGTSAHYAARPQPAAASTTCSPPSWTWSEPPPAAASTTCSPPSWTWSEPPQQQPTSRLPVVPAAIVVDAWGTAHSSESSY